MAVQPHASRPESDLAGWVGFWLWALVGAGLVFGAISFIIFFLIPPILLAVLLGTRSRWNDGLFMLGMVAGAGLPLLVVAGLQWKPWHHRIVGDATPNPYYWGAVGICLLLVGIVLYAIRRPPAARENGESRTATLSAAARAAIDRTG